MSEGVAAELAALKEEVARLREKVERHDDVLAVRALQFKYGYYMDMTLFGEIVELFAEGCEIRFMGGLYRGRAGARRLYGGASGLNGPTDGMLFSHVIAQDIVDVAPDGRTAKGRFRTFMQGGVHESKTNAPPSIPAQFWEGGIYENEYVKEDGVWKFKVFDYRVVFQARYEDGWARSPLTPLMVAEPTVTFPQNPRGPDEVIGPVPRWPKAVVQPFHYPNPVTGTWWRPAEEA
jgi:SnoaL-like domain